VLKSETKSLRKDVIVVRLEHLLQSLCGDTLDFAHIVMSTFGELDEKCLVFNFQTKTFFAPSTTPEGRRGGAV